MTSTVGIMDSGLALPRGMSLDSVLIGEVKNEVMMDYPILSSGLFLQLKKGEDFSLVKTDCQRVLGDGSSTYSVFGIFDGHNGSGAAIYSKEHLLNNVMSAIPAELTKEEWLAALPRAMVAGFVKTDSDFQKQGKPSGTTATIVVVDGWTVTVACVGDSRCILDSQGVVTNLTVDHRLDTNQEEKERLEACGVQVARIRLSDDMEIGPLRCWPGGLCLSRSIGDMDVGNFIVPIPFVKQVKISPAGGRLVIASDGVWDALSSEKAVKCCRSAERAEVAAKHIVKDALRSRGLRDDTTCLVVDLFSPASPRPTFKRQNSLLRMLRRNSLNRTESFSDLAAMEEIFEESSAMLEERLGAESSVHAGNELIVCSACRSNIQLASGISVHAGSLFSPTSRLWERPLLCSSCKREGGMEDKLKPQLE